MVADLALYMVVYQPRRFPTVPESGFLARKGP